MEDVGADGKSASRSAKKPVKRAKIEKAEESGAAASSSATASGEPQANQMQSGTVQTEQQVAARLAEKKAKCAEWAAFLAKQTPRPKSLRESLVEFYRVHNPSKLPDIEKVTDHYNVYGDPKLWLETSMNEMHTPAYRSGTVQMRLNRMFTDINTHYGVPSSDGTTTGARPREPDMRTAGERLSAANLTSAKPGGGATPIPLKKGAPVWAHILSFHNFCEYPTHIFGGGAHRSRNLGLIVHPELELRLLCRGLYRALVSGETLPFSSSSFLLLLLIGDMLPCVFFFLLGSIG